MLRTSILEYYNGLDYCMILQYNIGLDFQTDRQTNRQSGRQTETETRTETYRHRERYLRWKLE